MLLTAPTEDEVPETTSLKDLGDIKIIVQSGQIVPVEHANSRWDKIPLQDEDTSSKTTKINERSKKALTHHVKYVVTILGKKLIYLTVEF